MMSAQYIRTQLPRAPYPGQKVRKPRRSRLLSPSPLSFACPLSSCLALACLGGVGWGGGLFAGWGGLSTGFWLRILVGGLPSGEVGFFEVGSWT